MSKTPTPSLDNPSLSLKVIRAAADPIYQDPDPIEAWTGFPNAAQHFYCGHPKQIVASLTLPLWRLAGCCRLRPFM